MSGTDYQNYTCKLCQRQIEFPVELAGKTIDCPHCQEKIELPASDKIVPPKKFPLRNVLIACAVALIVGGVARSLLSGPPLITSPSIMEPKNVSQTTISQFGITGPDISTSGGKLVYAVGSLKNLSSKQRFGVRVDLDLFDEHGGKVGVATDYTAVIEAGQEWKYRALVTEPKAVSAKIIGIKEDK